MIRAISTRRLALNVVLGCVGLAMGLPASAQSGQPGTPAAQPRIITRGGAAPGMPQTITTAGGAQRMERYATALGLDQTQTTAAKDLYDAYQKSVSSAAMNMRTALKDAQSMIQDGDMAGFAEKTQQAMAEQREATGAAEKSFLEDLRALLTPAQADNWPKFERMRRREQLMTGMGSGISGAGVDLFKIVDSINMPADEKAKVQEALGHYDLDLDRLLIERKRLNDQMQEQAGAPGQMKVRRIGAGGPGGDKAGGLFGHDTDKIAEVNEKQREVDLQVRDLNDKTVRAMADVLEEPWKGKLLERVQQQAFRSIYRESAVSKKIKAARKLDTLTAQQRNDLKALAAKYQADARPMNDAWAAARKKAETAGRASAFPTISIPGMDLGQGDEDPDLSAARTARRDLDRSAREQMEKMLTPEQLAQIPDAAGPGSGGLLGNAIRVESFGTEDGNMMFVSSDEITLDPDEVEAGEGGSGGVVIMRTIEVGGQPVPPAQGEPAPQPKK